VVVVDFCSFAAMQEPLRQLEEAELLRAIAEGREEHRQGKTRKIKLLPELRCSATPHTHPKSE
jgi:hypothetical protein